MGLDMYFYARKSKYNMFSTWDEEDGKQDLTNYPADLTVMADYIKVQNFKSSVIKEDYQIGYFRKFNALHNYLVNVVDDGNDDCEEIELSRDTIAELKAVCERVLEDRDNAPALLPTKDGFFFGDTDYDEWYFKDVERAVELLDKILTNVPEDYNIIYQASW